MHLGPTPTTPRFTGTYIRQASKDENGIGNDHYNLSLKLTDDANGQDKTNATAVFGPFSGIINVRKQLDGYSNMGSIHIEDATDIPTERFKGQQLTTAHRQYLATLVDENPAIDPDVKEVLVPFIKGRED